MVEITFSKLPKAFPALSLKVLSRAVSLVPRVSALILTNYPLSQYISLTQWTQQAWDRSHVCCPGSRLRLSRALMLLWHLSPHQAQRFFRKLLLKVDPCYRFGGQEIRCGKLLKRANILSGMHLIRTSCVVFKEGSEFYLPTRMWTTSASPEGSDRLWDSIFSRTSPQIAPFQISRSCSSPIRARTLV